MIALEKVFLRALEPEDINVLFSIENDSSIERKTVENTDQFYDALDIFENYDKIFYVDSDAVITKICPNIFEYNTLSAVKDNNNANRQYKKDK